MSPGNHIYTVEYLEDTDPRLSPYQRISVQRGNHWWIIIDSTRLWLGYQTARAAESLATTMNNGRGLHENISKTAPV
jgi:hypothetical protein